MCIQVRDEEFRVVHHELGHTYYQLAYNEQPFLFQNSANAAFHEAIGDTVALSVTPEYLARIGLIDTVPPAADDIGLLLQQALDKVAFLPFGVLIDQWRWRVFSGEVTPANYNAAWWEMRTRYQGVAPPVERTEQHFDPAPSTTCRRAIRTRATSSRTCCSSSSTARCAKPPGRRPAPPLLHLRQPGSRRAPAEDAGDGRQPPVARRDGGADRPPRMDAQALLDYFAPLKVWLDEQNKGERLGW
jgi:peptidyl-dipeptidase A